ncbi:hypothetical protein LEN26_014738 [Aphanomyces euteiches]|nr:hypothetical protein LEN26_014738 [Aphanomyces euteiches]KAH9119803.1 hypothetical protein AeMF1_007723 [Aphanomyces euteiches]
MDDRSVESIDAKEEEDVQEEELHDNLTDEKGERSLMDRAVDSLNQLCASFEDICKSRLDQFQTRLAASQARLPHIQCYLKQQQDTMASLELQLRESVAKYKSWQQKWSKEKEDRRMEKELMADIWPDFVVVPPTILKPFMKDLSAGEKQKRSEASWMKMRLDEEGLRVQERIAHVDNYYYNATTGESSWKMPPVMAYAPLGYREKPVERRCGRDVTWGFSIVAAKQCRDGHCV